jgi:hypothetical protein
VCCAGLDCAARLQAAHDAATVPPSGAVSPGARSVRVSPATAPVNGVHRREEIGGTSQGQFGGLLCTCTQCGAKEMGSAKPGHGLLRQCPDLTAVADPAGQAGFYWQVFRNRRLRTLNGMLRDLSSTTNADCLAFQDWVSAPSASAPQPRAAAAANA